MGKYDRKLSNLAPLPLAQVLMRQPWKYADLALELQCSEATARRVLNQAVGMRMMRITVERRTGPGTQPYIFVPMFKMVAVE